MLDTARVNQAEGEVPATEAERQHFEHRLQQAQRLESVGLLARGVVHDFSNILQSVIGNAQLALEDLPSGGGVRESVEAILEAARRGSDLTQRLLSYARSAPMAVEPVEVSSLAIGMRPLLESVIRHRCKLVFELADAPAPAEINRAQIEQVLLNLVANAATACGEGGVVRVITGRETLTEPLPDAPLPGAAIEAGTYVTLSVVDNGRGMDAATMARMFEPFFAGESNGCGLGLTAVWGIVRGHRGGLRVTSAPGQGSAFHIYLPAAEWPSA
jgi:signal transduction histidine kinase